MHTPLLHLFNPDNDLALASGKPRYTPPKKALALRRAGEMLPLWYASEGDRIVTQGVDNRWFEHITEQFNIRDIDIYDHSPLPGLRPAPWGWSAAARTAFIDAGLSPTLLPSDDEIAAIRALSHRRTASLLAADLAADPEASAMVANSGHILAAPAVEAFTVEDALAAIKTFGSECMLKMPWSGSGRGVFDTAFMDADRTRLIISQTIASQGSVMIEPEYSGITDFALLFQAHPDGRCSLWGYSTFTTSGDGRYLANRLMEKQVHRQLLSDLVCFDIEHFGHIMARHLESIIAGHYVGPLGVDMLVGFENMGRAVFHPAVEVNLRCTMGVVAQHLAQRYVHPEALAEREVTFSTAPADTRSSSPEITVEDGRMLRGTMLLTPPNPDFAFTVKVH